MFTVKNVSFPNNINKSTNKKKYIMNDTEKL